MNIESCESIKIDSTGHESVSLRPLVTPEITFDLSPHASDSANLAPFELGLASAIAEEISTLAAVKDIAPPVPLNRVNGEYSECARTHRIQGTCVYHLVVDEHGLPKDLQIVKPIDPSLQKQASEAVHKYRFKLAMKDRMAIPVRITVDVTFQLFEQP